MKLHLETDEKIYENIHKCFMLGVVKSPCYYQCYAHTKNAIIKGMKRARRKLYILFCLGTEKNIVQYIKAKQWVASSATS